MISEGDKAPAFDLPASTGKNVALKDLAGKKNVVLYFYPRDMTPGCTVEACDFRDRNKPLTDAGAVVLGISTDDVDTHGKFIRKENLNFTLLTDADHKTAEAYGVWVEKNLYGKTSMGIRRATFVIDKKGVVRKAWPKVKVEGHAEEVLAFVRENLK
jgi:peroxiredoxin Q/BCP